MILDIVIPTYNRSQLLRRTLESIFRETLAANLEVKVTVVDNNSSDDTAELTSQFPVHYVFEKRPGRSYALNTGISASGGDLIGMLDDDEEISPNWYFRVAESFRSPGLDFIGGPYEPKFELPPPKWLTGNLRGAVGWMDFGNTAQPYGPEFNGLLLGGNVVIRRSVLQKVGLYNTSVGRTGKRLMTGEDDDMYERLLRSGARGMYFPDLVVYHWIPSVRLKKQYLRRWSFWAGVSEGIRDRNQPLRVPRILGVPRYRYGKLFRAAAEAVRQPGSAFTQELSFWSLAGFFYGRRSRKFAGA